MAAQIDPATKARALELYVTEGAAAAAAATGVKAGTVRYWASKAGLFTQRKAEGSRKIEGQQLTAAEQRAELAQRLYVDAARLLSQLFAPAELVKIVTLAQGEKAGSVAEVVRAKLNEPTAGEKRHLAVAAAVLLDKAQLLSGEATARFGAGAGTDWERELQAFTAGAAAATEPSRSAT